MWLERALANLQKSIDFYTKVLGMTLTGRGKVEQSKGETAGLQNEKNGFVLGLNYYEKDSPYHTEYKVGDGLDQLAFKVDDPDKALEKARKAGHRTVLEMKADGSRWGFHRRPR